VNSSSKKRQSAGSNLNSYTNGGGVSNFTNIDMKKPPVTISKYTPSS